MFIIRPIKENDLDMLMSLLQNSGHGLTSLPKDEKIIKTKIKESLRSFKDRRDGPAGETYLFVMEEIFTGRIVGVSGIISKIGGFEAYYFYKVKEQKLESKMMSSEINLKTLHLEKIHSGPAEICSLFLDPTYRNSQNGRFLSLSRFLYMAENADYFEDEVIAEMRGRVDDNGESPFWNAVGHKFINIDFLKADFLTLKSKRFLDDLIPKYPVIANLLPIEAQEVIGEVHPTTVPARRILEQEGFKYNNLVGLLEPGPILETKLHDVRSFKESKVIEVSQIQNEEIQSEVFIISTSNQKDSFKATLGNLLIDESGKAHVHAVTATALKLKLGDKLRFVSLK